MSLLRNLKWGGTDAQQADFYLALTGGRSQVVDKCSGDQVSATAYEGNYYAQICPSAGMASNETRNRAFIKIAMAKLRAQLGHSPVIVAATYNAYQLQDQAMDANAPWKISLFRFLRYPDWSDCSMRYLDISASTPWGDDAGIYAPVPGLDHHPTEIDNVLVPATGTVYMQWWTWHVANEIAFVLAANLDLCLLQTYAPIGTKDAGGNPQYLFLVWKDATRKGFWPYLSISYLMPVEFFGTKADNSIDLTNVLNNTLDLGVGNLFLGAVERGEIGTPIPAFVKNLSTRDLAHLEVWDDAPEWSTPAADAANTGDAALAYVTLLDTAVSQKYTIKFISATEYQVKGEAYGDNATNLHNQFSNAGWQGEVGTDWSAPSGGLTIPAAAWSGTAVANDVFVLYVHGQTTDQAWPADSGAQVEMAKDDAGAPDDATWRPIKGQRTRLADAVTIDSTTKTLTVEHIVTADWPAERKMFIADGTNIDEGHVDSCTATSITVHFGSATDHSYAVGAKVCSTLPFRDLTKSVRGVTSAAAGASQSNPAQIPLTGASTLGFTPASKIVIQSSADDDVFEEATILSADTSKIVCTAYLAHDYEAGATVLQGGGGEARLWLRLNTLLTTVEELKRVRLNVRT